jgi:hypothetical protein
MAQYENNDKNASDAYTARQLSGGDQYDPNATMGGGVPTQVHSNAAGDVQARELAENDIAREARRKIMAILEEDESPQYGSRPQRGKPSQHNTGTVRRKSPGALSLDELAEGERWQQQLAVDEKVARDMGRKSPGALSLDDLMEGMDNSNGIGMADSGMTSDDLAAMGGGLNDIMNTTAVDLMHSGYNGDDNEAAQLAESMAGRPQQPADSSWDWVTVKGVATLASGNKVTVWMVENTSNGMEMKKPFRVQAPAERIASLLNVAGNVNDPRIKQIHEDYDRYVGLTKQFRNAKKLYESGNRDAGKTGTRIAAELRGIKQRLGI